MGRLDYCLRLSPWLRRRHDSSYCWERIMDNQSDFLWLEPDTELDMWLAEFPEKPPTSELIFDLTEFS